MEIVQPGLDSGQAGTGCKGSRGRFYSGPRRNDVEENGEVVGNAAGQNKQVP
jgi:hypothetical protein